MDLKTNTETMTNTASVNTVSSMNTGTETKSVWMHIDGIVCYACTGIIESLAKNQPGVISAAASYVSEGLRLDVEPEAELNTLINELERHGYKARITTEREAMRADHGNMKALRVRILISFFLSLLLVPYPFLSVPPYIQLAAATLVQIIAGRSFHRDALYAVSSGTANMSVLISIGTLSAYIFSAISVFTGTGQIFFESSGTVLVLVMLGKYLERSARVSSSESVRKLLEWGPAEATITDDAGERKIPAEKIRKGDRFVTRRGEIFPADGTVLEGSSMADESALTGESRPARKGPGSYVYATTINMSDRIIAQADRDYSDSVYCSMRRALLNGVNGKKADLQRIADKVCSRFIPAVLALAIVTLCIWYAFLKPGDLVTAVIRASCVLIIACPCAMGIATPMAMTTAVGALGRTGIFVKSQTAIETLARADVIVLDKTGTLTLPEPDGGERLREGTQITIETLHKLGIEVWLFTGDRRDPALKAAQAAGIPLDHVRYELLPEDKAELLKELQKLRTVCMVGDGVNDALSLTLADAGVAIGRAAEISVECADMVITRNRITHLLKAVYIGRVTLQNIRRSLFWALFYNVIGLGICVAGLITPVIAGTAMSLSSLSVVLNAQSLDKKIQKLTFKKIASAPRIGGRGR